ncbi:MAG: 23S rRNA (guanosine-2'-O-)-methyltransferase RlmB [Chlamydiia bacterium]|nr:23S rRNA (guanosine-2'-O-)-methyltransferase RlmB [Chlamydiia bacterium]
MLTFQIKSLQHSIVKYCQKLRTSAQFRKKEDCLIVCGKKIIQELPKAYKLKSIFLLKDEKLKRSPEKKYLVTEGILRKITNQKNPEPYAAIVEMPHFKDLSITRLLICDEIKDPGNMGTLMRTALGLGFDAIFLLNDCVDPYNEKVINASKGALFSIPIIRGNWEYLLEFRDSHKLKLYQADLGGDSFLELNMDDSIGLILGSESHGTSKNAKKHATKLTIPMTKKTESLNVAVAGGILMFHVSTLCQKI